MEIEKVVSMFLLIDFIIKLVIVRINVLDNIIKLIGILSFRIEKIILGLNLVDNSFCINVDFLVIIEISVKIKIEIFVMFVLSVYLWIFKLEMFRELNINK